MIEFTRENYLWLLGILAVYFVAWLLARRYHTRRVTYGAIWKKVAASYTPPAWKRLLRTILTLLFAAAMIGSGSFHAAGAQKPLADEPQPLFIVIWLDNTYSMRLQHEGQTRLQAISKRAKKIVKNLQHSDRAVLAWMSHGQPIAGPILSFDSEVSVSPLTDPTEITSNELHSFVDSLAMPAPATEGNSWQTLVWWLSDRDLSVEDAEHSGRMSFASKRLGKYAFVSEAIGADAHNTGITTAEIKLADSDAEYFADLYFEATGPTFLEINGETLPVSSPAKLLRSANGHEVRLFTNTDDSLPGDDEIRFRLPDDGIQNVVVCYPIAEGSARQDIVGLLETLLAGRNIKQVAVGSGSAELPDDIDLLVADRVIPDNAVATNTLYLGVIDQSLGKVRSAVRAEPNMQIHPASSIQGWAAPDLRLISAHEAFPVDMSIPATVLVKHRLGGALLAVGDGFMYSGFIPHQSSLLNEGAGVLLLLRWLRYIGKPNTESLPILGLCGRKSSHKLSAGEWCLKPPHTSFVGSTPRKLLTTADGHIEITMPESPGIWSLQRDEQVRQLQLLAAPEWKLNLILPSNASLDLSRLTPDRNNQDWRDLLPTLLLWIAASALVLDHIFWLIGMTE